MGVGEMNIAILHSMPSWPKATVDCLSLTTTTHSPCLQPGLRLWPPPVEIHNPEQVADLPDEPCLIWTILTSSLFLLQRKDKLDPRTRNVAEDFPT